MLPAAAAGFGTGILMARWFEPARPEAVGLLLVGLACAGASFLAGRSKPRRSRELLARRGLGSAPVRALGPRERILAAAGIPTAEPAAVDRRPIRGLVVALLGVALLGAGWSVLRRPTGAELAAFDGRTVSFRGSAVSDVQVYEWGWAVEVRLAWAGDDATRRTLDSRVWMSADDRAPPVEAGQVVEGSGILRRIQGGGSGFEEWLVDRGVVATVSVHELSVRGPPSNLALRVANGTRGALRRGIWRTLPPAQGGLLLGLSIGDTSRMTPEVEEDFRATGLGHLVAVSGSNVAMFLAPVIALTGRLRTRRGLRLTVAVLAVGFFALLTRWEPSVLRASAMAVVALVGVWAGRPRSTGVALGGAVLALLVVDPDLAASVAFQLSVAATLGLALLAGPVAGRLHRFPRPVAAAAGATVAAQVGVTPLLLLHFGVVPTVTLLANLLAFPAVPVALLVGTLAAAVGLVWEPVGAGLGDVAAAPLGYLIGLADRLARAPLPHLTADGVLAPVLAALLGGVVVWRLRRGRRRVGTVLVAVAVGAAAWAAAPDTGPPSSLTVTFLDVGQGDAAVVRTPDGATILVDSGPEEDLVARKLASLGVGRIDLAVASHSHADHVTGFPAILARFPVGLLLEPGCPHDASPYRRFLDAVRSEGVPVRHPRGGERMTVGSVRVEILGPDRCSPDGDSPNDESIVLRIVDGTSSILFTGDAEVAAQRDLLEDGDPVQATVLKVPHQGGDTSDPAFLDAVGSRVAVVSVGPNEYGHPNPGVLAALEAEGMLVVRTDLAGDVAVSFGPSGPLVESSR